MSITINISEAPEAIRSSVSATVDSDPAPPVVSMEESIVGDEQSPAPPLPSDFEGDGNMLADSESPSPPETGAGLTSDAFDDAEAPVPPNMNDADETAEAINDAPTPPMMESDSSAVVMLAAGDEEGGPMPPVVAGADIAEFSLANLDMDPPPIENESEFGADESSADIPPSQPEENDEKATRTEKSPGTKSRKKK
jgi:hypothetical protein